MRLLAIVALLMVLGGGLALSYIAFRQFETKTALLDAPAQLAPQPDGSGCGAATLVVEPRTMGRWFLPVQEDQRLAGAVLVGGGEGLDVGLRIFDPNNGMVLLHDEREHEIEFELNAELRGDYRFEIDNRHSVFTKKDVTINLCVG